MRVAFLLDLAQLGIRVLVMRDTHLVVTLNLATSHLDPFASTDEVLRLDTLISEEFLTRHQINELCSGNRFPHHAHHSTIVNLEGRLERLRRPRLRHVRRVSARCIAKDAPSLWYRSSQPIRMLQLGMPRHLYSHLLCELFRHTRFIGSPTFVSWCLDFLLDHDVCLLDVDYIWQQKPKVVCTWRIISCSRSIYDIGDED